MVSSETWYFCRDYLTDRSCYASISALGDYPLLRDFFLVYCVFTTTKNTAKGTVNDAIKHSMATAALQGGHDYDPPSFPSLLKVNPDGMRSRILEALADEKAFHLG